MFTGIVTDVGVISKRSEAEDIVRFRIDSHYNPKTINLGDSIAVSGVCLTVTEFKPRAAGMMFEVEATLETLRLTTASHWQVNTKVNLEQSLQLDSRLGGHLVLGHVDCVTSIVARRDHEDFTEMTFKMPEQFARMIAKKGSIALDGTSLTVNAVDETTFQVALIPHTLAVTTWKDRVVGDRINLEVDPIARYVDRNIHFKDDLNTKTAMDSPA